MTAPTLTQAADQGKRLDVFLTEKLADKTRSQIKKMIRGGTVLINGKPASVHHFLKSGDVITFDTGNERTETANQNPATAPAANHASPEIIFEDDDFVAINKPTGMLVHPTEKGEHDTVVDWLVARYPTIVTVGEHKYRSGIIHRLDRDVSGAMVAAKNQHAFEYLKEQFKTRQVKKIYLAVVYGHIDADSGTIELPIGRNRQGQFVAHPRQGLFLLYHDDRVAKTEYRVLQYLKDYTVVEVKILTGRTHQIRAHFSAIGHPILGDSLYKPKNKIFRFLRRRIKVIDPAKLGRIFLHSQTIGFYDLANQWRECSAPIPPIINEFINGKATA